MIQFPIPDFHRQVLAVNRVERLLLKVTRALEDANVPYAVVGGNAVAAWVATVDDGAVRATKDVDILLRRADLDTAEAALKKASLDRHDIHGVTMFLTRRTPNPRTGAHVVFANERVRESDAYPSPDVSEATRSFSEFNIIGLEALLRMKLTANRRVDQLHVEDMLALGLIGGELASSLPEDLRSRLEHIRTTR